MTIASDDAVCIGLAILDMILALSVLVQAKKKR